MSDSLRILTYNTQLRSFGMEALAQWSALPYSSTEERAAAIAERILRSPQDYDVVCLNEVFDEDAREVLEDRLRPKYRHAVFKADDSELHFIHAGPPPFEELVVPAERWSAGIGFDAEQIFARSRGKLEDSGLMLFSRLPFAQVPPSADLLALLKIFGVGAIASVPVVLFCPYPDSNFDDSLAAKGVIYARLMRGSKPLHLVMSHTQSDPTGRAMEHRETRAKQFGLVERLLEAMVGSPPFDEEVVLCGDLNVNGLARGGDKANEEAVALFADEFSFWRRHASDVWWWDQCPGDPALINHMPLNCDPGMTVPGQRLDYFLRARFAQRLVTQHVAVAWDVAQAGAESPPLTRYSLPRAPIFIRVSLLDRHDELNYRLFVHRYDGTAPEDAIGLVRGVPLEFDCKTDAPHSLDRPETQFNDHDCVWFTATLDTPPLGRARVQHRVVIDRTDPIPGTGDHAFGALAAARRSGGPIEEIAQAGGGEPGTARQPAGAEPCPEPEACGGQSPTWS